MEGKKMRRISSNSESGAILAIVIILMLALTITGIAFLNAGVMENRLVGREVHKNQAFYLAEAGVEDARFKLGDNWDTLTSIDDTPLGEGTYIADIYETDENGDLLYPDDPSHPMYNTKRRIRSTGTVKNVSQIVQVIVRQIPSSTDIDAVLESGGTVQVKSNAVTISGKVKARDGIIDEHDQIDDLDEIIDPLLFSDPDAYFEEIFNTTKDQMMEKAKRDGIYYEYPPNNAPAHEITWVEVPEGSFQITRDDWLGEGILIVNGDLQITGGIFNGIIWVTGNIAMGNPVINGAVFVEGEITVDIAGTVDLIYDPDAIGDAIDEIGTLPWVEFWEQLK